MQAKHVIAGLMIAVALTCGARADQITVDGRSRTFTVYRPAGLGRARTSPLVIVLHGGLGSGAQAERAYHWDEEADHHGFIVAYPDGYHRSWNAGGLCCGPAHRDGVDDVAFLTRLFETMVRDHDADPRRVYLAGISNGAAMAYWYACKGPFPVAAIGGVAGSFASECPHPRAVPVIEIHGRQDGTVRFEGGHGRWAKDVNWLGVEATLAPFRAANRCGPPQTQTRGVITTTVSACVAGHEVELITIADAGHQWPGSVPERGFLARLLRLDPPSQALDATDALWTFFAHHSAE